MAHDSAIDEPQTSLSTLPSRAVRHDGWTAHKQVDFLRVLAATQSVAAAASSVGMGRQSAYKLRARLDDAPFGAAWRLALGGGRDLLIEAALDRAINGVEVPHYWKGELVGTSRRFDERLTALLLASDALKGRSRTRHCAESEFAQHDLARLIERIETGPPQWCDYESERDFAWGDSLEEEEPEEWKLEFAKNDDGGEDEWDDD